MAEEQTQRAHYRCVPEADVVKLLRLAGFVYDGDEACVTSTIMSGLKRWRQAGLKFRSGPSGRLYDPGEVVNFLKRLGLSGADRFWSERYVATGRKLVADLAELPSGGRFHVTFRRTFNRSPTGVADRRLRLRVPLPLEDYGDTSSLQMHLPGDAKSRREDGRLEVLTSESGPTTITLEFDFTPTLVISPDVGDLDLYLRPKEGFVVITPRIADLAASLAAGCPTAGLETVRAFWDFIFDRLICGVVHYDEVDLSSPGDWVLDNGLYDCQLGSALLIALCRSKGLPARMVGGYVLYERAPTNHFWTEVYLDGKWTPFDLLSWDLSLGGRDPEWRYHFFGRLDQRLVTQKFPRQFTGPLGVATPPSWYMLQQPMGKGIVISLNGLDGKLVYTDVIEVASRTGAVIL